MSENLPLPFFGGREVMPKSNLPEVVIYTDGSCSPNPGNGAWCAILMFGKHKKVLSGKETGTTNNRMEMQAMIEGLRALTKPCAVRIVSDSRICLGVVNRTGKKAHKRENQDLVQALLSVMAKHEVTGEWVKGHSGHALNEECDEIAGSLHVSTTP